MMVQTTKGQIRGVDKEYYVEYRGIPYAKAPVGELRWKAPQETAPWDGVLEADCFGNRCMQEDHLVPPYDKDFYADPAFMPEISEDCLYLHIWAPKETGGQKLPVAFWIHGGAFMGGFSSELEFDGAAYCKRGVILVSVEYRCNVFGFLAHPWLSAESPMHVSGNYGILDQIMALNWVYENIAAFGGNPENITIFGQSAGAMSVQTLISTELTGNKIAKAIMQSGGSYGGGLHHDITLAQQENYGKLLQEILQVKSLQEMRNLPAIQIQEAVSQWAKAVGAAPGELFMTPALDHYVLDGTYYGLMDEGKIKNIPYMLGTTQDDILVTPEMRAQGTYSELYHGCIQFSEKLQELGRTPAYVYYFKRELPGDNFGAFHSSELWYTFGTLDRCWRPMETQDYELSERMLDYWTDFMKTGDPNGSGHAQWDKCTREHPVVFEF